MTGIFENRFLQSVFLSTLEKFREFGMCSENAQTPWDELNHQTKKGAIRTDWKMITFEPNTYFTLPAHSTLSHTKVSIARELYSLPRTHSSLTHHNRFYHHQHILHSAHTLDFLSHEQYSLLRTPFSPTNSLFPQTSLSNPISQKLTSLSPHTRISLTNISSFHELHSLPRIHFHLTHHSPAQYHQHILHSPHTLDSFSHEHYFLSRTSFSLTNSSLTHHPRIQYHQHILRVWKISQHTDTPENETLENESRRFCAWGIKTHYNTLQHAATRCSTPPTMSTNVFWFRNSGIVVLELKIWQINPLLQLKTFSRYDQDFRFVRGSRFI